MIAQGTHGFMRHRLRAKPMYLTITLFAFILLSPIFGAGYRGEAVLHVSFSLILFSALWALGNTRRRLVGAIAGIPWLLTFWMDVLIDFPNWLVTLGTISMVLFFAFLIVEMIVSMVNQDRVTEDTIYQAVSTYLLLGIMWMGLYALVHRANPEAISFMPGAPPESGEVWRHLLYMSYATLTTVGYGDITPVSATARALAMVEATVGPLYLAVLLARLVGLFTRQQQEDVGE